MSSAAGSAGEDEADELQVRAYVRDRFVDMFLSQNRRAQGGLLISALLVAWIWFARTQATAALLWTAAALLVTALRFAFTESWVRASRHTAGLSPTGRIVAVLGVNGVLMALPLLAFGHLTELERAGVSIILMATATASVATTSGYRFVFLAFAAPMLVALALAWALTAPIGGHVAAARGLALLIGLYLLFLASVGRQAQQVFEESSRYRHAEQGRNRQLQQALATADEASRAKTQFLAAASHDLRQPIHGMNVLVAALSLHELTPRAREIVVLLESVNQVLSRQLDGLLDISKLDAGIVRPDPAPQRLDRLLTTLHGTLAPVARERGIELRLHIEDSATAQTDGPLLVRVLSNLCDNAIKFTRRGGRITLGLRREGSQAVLSVADTGIGIARNEQARVFAEFYQVGNVERDRTRGLGLGLAIVRRLCTLLDVQLTLSSELGTGTTVRLCLPALPVQAEPTPPAPAPMLPAGLSVLVIDDEPMVRESMRLLLSAMDCSVHLADSTEHARAIATAHTLDAVLSDFRLREGDSGLAALQAVRSLRPRAACALITGDTAPDRIREARSIGVPLLHKPVTLNDLLSVLRAEPRQGAASQADQVPA